MPRLEYLDPIRKGVAVILTAGVAAAALLVDPAWAQVRPSPDKPLDNEAGFRSLYNGKNFDGWAGPVHAWEAGNGVILCKPNRGGTVYTKEEFADFVVRLEYKLPPGGNNGLAIRYPGKGDSAYVGMCEIQILDDSDPKYAKLDPRKFNGSAYNMVAATRGHLKPTGEWNAMEVTVVGPTIKVVLNGSVILDSDLSKVTKFVADKPHPGKDRTRGHFGFAGHGHPVEFRNIRIKPLVK